MRLGSEPDVFSADSTSVSMPQNEISDDAGATHQNLLRFANPL